MNIDGDQVKFSISEAREARNLSRLSEAYDFYERIITAQMVWVDDYASRHGIVIENPRLRMTYTTSRYTSAGSSTSEDIHDGPVATDEHISVPMTNAEIKRFASLIGTHLEVEDERLAEEGSIEQQTLSTYAESIAIEPRYDLDPDDDVELVEDLVEERLRQRELWEHMFRVATDYLAKN